MPEGSGGRQERWARAAGGGGGGNNGYGFSDEEFIGGGSYGVRLGLRQ